MIKESCNLLGRETQLTTINQKWCSLMLPSLDDYLHAKKSMRSTDSFQKY